MSLNGLIPNAINDVICGDDFNMNFGEFDHYLFLLYITRVFTKNI